MAFAGHLSLPDTYNMKPSLLLAIYGAVASALSTGYSDQRILENVASAEEFLVELEPGVTRWVSEDEKWELRRVCHCLLNTRARPS